MTRVTNLPGAWKTCYRPAARDNPDVERRPGQSRSLIVAWTELSTLTGTGGLMEWLEDGSETGSPPTLGSVFRRFYRLRSRP